MAPMLWLCNHLLIKSETIFIIAYENICLSSSWNIIPKHHQKFTIIFNWYDKHCFLVKVHFTISWAGHYEKGWSFEGNSIGLWIDRDAKRDSPHRLPQQVPFLQFNLKNKMKIKRLLKYSDDKKHNNLIIYS